MGFSFIEKFAKLENTEDSSNGELLENKHIYVPDWFKIMAC